ncbi:uncharacterized protein LODBEIA_P33890 [Lodderomyces beijingensis]|uniref:Uncharacterized protein n=1 Tax=Lodderomyces beijingensis TaxID=1775926 RepID=A0ABP0ZSH6_9ASCO
MTTAAQHPYRQVSSAPSSAPYPLSDFNVAASNSQSDPSDSSPSMTEVTSGIDDLQISNHPHHLPHHNHHINNNNNNNSHSQFEKHYLRGQRQAGHNNPQVQQYGNEQQVQQQQSPLQQYGSLSQSREASYHQPQQQQQQQRSVTNGSGSSFGGVSLPAHLIPNLPNVSSIASSDELNYGAKSQAINSPVQIQSFDQSAFLQSPKIGITNGRNISGSPYPDYEASTPPPVFAGRDGVIVSPPSNPLSSASSVTNLNLNSNNQPPANNLSLDNQMFSRSENNLSTPSVSKFGHNRSVSSTSSFFYERNDNSSMVDFNQNVLQQYLGSNSQHLMPRIKTLELYRKNAKKSNDPNVLFQYAQYMLQTALIVASEANISNASATSSQSSGESSPPLPNSPRKLDARDNKDGNKATGHKKNKSIDFANIELEGNEKKLRRSLLKEAVYYLKRLSDKGYVEAQYLLADAYSSGALDKVENREAFILFQSAAKHGHVESAYRTSYCYEEGLGTGRDARKAVEYLKIAAAKNHPAAMYKLGVYSFYARMGLPNDMNTKKMGIKWLTRATNVATELTAAAPFELGKLYYNGFEDIVIADKKYALELYAQAAALGHTQSAAILGSHYEFGDAEGIIPQDANLSIHYYTQAALGGDANAMLSMCAWYLVGADPYLPKDEGEAFEWAKRAAACNLAKAQFALANFYQKGIGCQENQAEAQFWYKKAAQQGDEKSLARLTDRELAKNISKKMRKSGSTNLASSAMSGHVHARGPHGKKDKESCVVM